MRHPTFVRSAVLAATVSLFSACGGDSTGPDFGDTFTEGNAEYFGEGVLSGAEQGMLSMHWGSPNIGLLGAPAFLGTRMTHHGSRPHPSRFPQPVAGAPVASYLSALKAAAPGCTISGSGSNGDPFIPYDGNGNDIPDDWWVKASCDSEEEVGEGVTIAYHDEVEVRMKERTDILWGFDASVKQRYTDKASDGSDHDEGYAEMTETLAVTARRAEYTQTAKFGGNGLDGTEPYFGEDGGNFKLVFTPGEDDIQPLTLYPDGVAALTGRVYSYDTDNPGWDWKISTPEPLLWSPECAVATNDPFIDGLVRVLLSGNAAKGFDLTPDGCDEGWGIDIYGDDVPVTARMPRGAPMFHYKGR